MLKTASVKTPRKAAIGRLLGNVLYPVCAFAFVIAVWAIVAAVKNLPILFPSVGEIFRALGDILSDGESWRAAGMTLGRITGSFLLSLLFAAVLATAGAFVKSIHKFVRPLVTVLQAAPTMAVILLAVVWLDNSEVPLLVGFLICFPLLYNTCHTALESVDGELLEMADVYHMRPVDKLTGIYLPAVFPVVTEGAKSAVSLTVKVVIAAEVLAQTRVSIGLLMQQDSVMFEIADLLAWTVFAIVLSFLLEGIIVGVQKLREVLR